MKISAVSVFRDVGFGVVSNRRVRADANHQVLIIKSGSRGCDACFFDYALAAGEGVSVRPFQSLPISSPTSAQR